MKTTLGTVIVPYLKGRFTAGQDSKTKPSASAAILTSWAEVSATLVHALPLESLFPVVDIFRLSVLDPAVATWTAGNALNPHDPLTLFLRKGTESAPRPYTLTVLRLLANAFSNPALASRLLANPTKTMFTSVLVPALLHPDASVRTAAASLAFNAAAVVQKARIEKVRSGGNGQFVEHEDEDWQVEMISALTEALDREKGSEDVGECARSFTRSVHSLLCLVHRLVASLAFILRLSPFYEHHLAPIVDVLQARSILRGKLDKGGCGPNGVEKKDVRKLIEEVARHLCP